MIDYTRLTYTDLVEHPEFWTDTVDVPNWASELYDRGLEPVSAVDFYDDVFGQDLEPHRLPEDYRTGEYGAIALELLKKKKDGKRVNQGHRVTVTDGCMELYDLINTSKNDCHIAPVSYAGRQRINANARFLYALCIEIDSINKHTGINELFYIFRRTTRPIPRPTYIVCSGTGLHLYWKFERPIPLFKNVYEKLKDAKTYMTRNLWDKQISDSWQHIQYESLLQPFRCVGSVCKNRKKRVLAFRCGTELSIEQFNARLPESVHITTIYKSNLTKQKAKELYPDWYQRRIVEEQPRGHWTRHQGIYYNWIKKICDTDKGAEVGHRYNCLENLCALAVQCEIPPEQVEEDVRKVAEHMETLTNDESNHFTEYDVLCALRTYYTATEQAYRRRIEYVSEKTGIQLTPNKRNGRTQEKHLQGARAIRDINNENWRQGNGRKPKKALVQEWRLKNPNGSKYQCIKETGISKPTVYKWWNVTE